MCFTSLEGLRASKKKKDDARLRKVEAKKKKRAATKLDAERGVAAAIELSAHTAKKKADLRKATTLAAKQGDPAAKKQILRTVATRILSKHAASSQKKKLLYEQHVSSPEKKKTTFSLHAASFMRQMIQDVKTSKHATVIAISVTPSSKNPSNKELVAPFINRYYRDFEPPNRGTTPLQLYDDLKKNNCFLSSYESPIISAAVAFSEERSLQQECLKHLPVDKLLFKHAGVGGKSDLSESEHATLTLHQTLTALLSTHYYSSSLALRLLIAWLQALTPPPRRRRLASTTASCA